MRTMDLDYSEAHNIESEHCGQTISSP